MAKKYNTQMEAARKGIVTDELKIVSEKERKSESEILELVAQGKVIIPANINHKNINPHGIGKGLRTKINVNLGISKDCCNFEAEMRKVIKAVEMNAEAIMDLSCYGDTRAFRRKLVAECSAIIGTVPVYDAEGFLNKRIEEIKSQEFLKVIEAHAQDGVDFMTIHAGINKDSIKRFEKNPRLTNIVSRGGALIFRWMKATGNENPFYEYFDDILEIMRTYDVAISLGDALRPGSINDATDASQIEELITLGELTKRAWRRDVQVMIEGPGHMPLNQIAANVLLEKKLCHEAPFYVLGPIVTDVAPGYDHITSAIGGAAAAAAGADFLCYVTPAEHLRLPTLDDMKEGIVAAKIAAHAADIAKGITNAEKWDYEMSLARKRLDWNKMFELALEPEKPRQYRKSSLPEEEDTCTMCGQMCAVRNMNRALESN